MSASWQHIEGEIVINAQLHAKPGQGDTLASWIEKMKAWAKENEPGTLEYTFARDAPDGDVFATWERFRDGDALKAHMTSDIMNEFKTQNLLAKPPTPLFYHGNIKGLEK
ncbi:hypothetical protein PUNSTDRAFT_131225 [Punctularia strigosozonata HHB-11173 SS5]|uniref:uncharacterized protein n=1 Tax=Punctularia strigosozonata (strain HHB-11173) TaxID=741275 RepID=UPI00044176CA|nr:uncharacterized protein PUNSTDRAFT_131225 [Punctularia strigosozonata HHB-11173 SS5]EIN12997.1 hypothetical protein PUNSTDRAFT_131225 [Punctularia strigosozonata HHB-11173 SS5]